MKNFMRIASGVDVMPLMMELKRQPELWNATPYRTKFESSPHRETDDIWLRYKDIKEEVETNDFSTIASEHDSVWYPAYDKLPSCRAMIFDLMARVQGERLGGVLIYRVPPGKQIYEHVDRGWHPEYYDKFNISLQSNLLCPLIYTRHDEAMRSDTGDVFWFRNTIPHMVKNDSNEDQIIMCVCIRCNAQGTGGK